MKEEDIINEINEQVEHEEFKNITLIDNGEVY